jgi:hypothetical protein
MKEEFKIAINRSDGLAPGEENVCDRYTETPASQGFSFVY